MRVYCPNCKSKAVITSSHKQSDTVTDLYCTCTNTIDCSASFVYTLSHKHYINPPLNTVQEAALSILRVLSRKELNDLLNKNFEAKQP